MKVLFKILDYMISSLMGAGTVCLVSLVIGESWNMFAAMIVGMFLGLAVLGLALMLFVYVSTAFELFPVGMVITMITGMAAGMVMSVAKVDLDMLIMAAATYSLLVQLGMDFYNMKLQGEVPIDRYG